MVIAAKNIGNFSRSGPLYNLEGSGKMLFNAGLTIVGTPEKNHQIPANARDPIPTIRYSSLPSNNNEVTIKVPSNGTMVADLRKSPNDPVHLKLTLEDGAVADFKTFPEGRVNIIYLFKFGNGAKMIFDYAKKYAVLKPNGKKIHLLPKAKQGHAGKFIAISNGDDIEVEIDELSSGTIEEQWGRVS